jgi:NDP-sugar pyrophosphorylase family protein
MQCIILAGGLGTRMRPWTESIPKLLIPVHGTPFADYQLRWLSANGVRDVIYCVAYKADMIREYVRDGSRWGLTVGYVDDGADPKGTGGALRMALKNGSLDESFFVLYGDSFLPISIESVSTAFQRCHSPALMTVYRNDNQWDSSNVIFQGGVVHAYDKHPSPTIGARMHYIDYGLSILTRKVVHNEIPESASDLADLYANLSASGRMAGYEVRERFYEIGSPQGLKDFERYVEKMGLLSASKPDRGIG